MAQTKAKISEPTDNSNLISIFHLSLCILISCCKGISDVL